MADPSDSDEPEGGSDEEREEEVSTSSDEEIRIGDKHVKRGRKYYRPEGKDPLAIAE